MTMNGINLTELERIFSPDHSSMWGFIGKNESLISVLKTDWYTVYHELHTTHNELANLLQSLIIRGLTRKTGSEVPYVFEEEKNIEADYEQWMGVQCSPLNETGNECWSQDFYLVNKVKNVSITVAGTPLGGILPFIKNYGFYEGNTRYRVDPRSVYKLIGK
eukprot:Phypoly_transcript_23025.p1 GENE.Phypoly_transcript_23025~~Phypoly_transcript_23025.p1  ORF type:complete len:187 (+),score=8.63 Phypoly_transcript_23025:76-561(+)